MHEIVRRNAMFCIFKSDNRGIAYKDKLYKLKIMPLSLYQEFIVVVHSKNIVIFLQTGEIDIDW